MSQERPAIPAGQPPRFTHRPRHPLDTLSCRRFQDNEVRWHSEVGAFRQSRRELSGANKLSAMWLKLVDPEEAEGEHYEVYERVLDSICKEVSR